MGFFPERNSMSEVTSASDRSALLTTSSGSAATAAPAPEPVVAQAVEEAPEVITEEEVVAVQQEVVEPEPEPEPEVAAEPEEVVTKSVLDVVSSADLSEADVTSLMEFLSGKKLPTAEENAALLKKVNSHSGKIDSL